MAYLVGNGSVEENGRICGGGQFPSRRICTASIGKHVIMRGQSLSDRNGKKTWNYLRAASPLAATASRGRRRGHHRSQTSFESLETFHPQKSR